MSNMLSKIKAMRYKWEKETESCLLENFLLEKTRKLQWQRIWDQIIVIYEYDALKYVCEVYILGERK